MAETRDNSSSIPPAGICVNKAIISVLAGHAVRVHPLGLSVSREATTSEVIASIGALWAVKDQTKLRVCFSIGDACSQARRRSDIGTTFLRALKKQFGVKLYNEFRRMRWVAEKWPKESRTDDRSWNWYLKNEPDTAGSPRPTRAPVKLRILGRYIVEGAEVIHLIDGYGRQYVGESVPDGDVSGT